MSLRTLVLLLLLAVAVAVAMRSQPSPWFMELPADFRQEPATAGNFFFADTTGFERVRKPMPVEWLAEHDELGQSFTEYVSGRPVRAEGDRQSLVFQPLGPFGPAEAEQLAQVARYCEVFFARPVRVERPILDLDEAHSRLRQAGHLSWRQFLTGYLLNQVLGPRLPDDAWGYLGVTMHDLYPAASWNFVFGQAKLRGRTGVFSLARYQAGFYGEPETADSGRALRARHPSGARPAEPADRWAPPARRALRRSCAVMAHESAHMLGLQHCVWYRCLMQGSNSLEELDSRPLMLCPICLRKLQWNLGFDPAERYRRLEEFLREAGLRDDARRIAARLEAGSDRAR